MERSVVIFLLVAALLLAGCGRRPEVLTKEHTGRRVGAYDVDGDHIAYVWYPAQHISTQGHLVLLNVADNNEVELESNLSGPMAMCRGRVVWWNARSRDDERKSDIIVYDLSTGDLSSIAHTRVQSLDADDNYVVWEESYDNSGSDIILYDLETEQQQTISSGGREGEMMHRDPHLADGTVAWEAYNRTTRTSTIAIFDAAVGKLVNIDIPQARPRLSVSAGRLLYCLNQGEMREIHLYDISAGSEKVIATLERLVTAPYLEGDKIAWCEHVPKEEFTGIPGQPLMNEKDIRDLFVYDLNSGKKRRIAGYLLATGGRATLHNGRVYLNVYREYPPPGKSNLVVPVDLWVW